MNVLFLSLTFPDRINPERGTFNLGLCAALAKEHNVHAIAPRGWHESIGGGRGRTPYRPTAETTASGIGVDYPAYWYLPKVMPHLRGEALWHSIRSCVTRLAKTFRPDVVLSYWAYPDGYAGLRAAQYFGIPSVIIVGGSDVLLMPKERGQEGLIAKVLQQSSCVATVSDGLRRAAIGLGAASDSVKTIRQGVDTTRFHPGLRSDARQRLGVPHDEEMLVWVGRMVPVKNLELLVTAVAAAMCHRPRLTLHLIGDGECRAALSNQVTAAGLDDRVRFESAISHDRLPDWYRAANLTVLSSRSEGLPNVLRESLACGTPFVATDVGDVREISGPGATLVPPGDVAALAGAIVAALGSEPTNLSEASYARTWSECASDFSALFAALRIAPSIKHSPSRVKGRA